MATGQNSKIKLRNIFSAIRVIFGIFILVALVYYIGTNNIISSIKSIKLYFFPIIVLFYFLFLLVSTLSIFVLLENQVSFFRLFKYYCISWVYGLILPGRIGEFSIIYFLKKEGIPPTSSFVVSLLDKFITLLFFIFITLIGSFLFFSTNQAIYVGILLISVLLCGILLPRTKIFLFFIPKKYKPFFHQYFEEYTSFFKKHNRKKVYYNILLTFVRWMLNSLLIFLIFLSFGISINIFYILIINTMTALISLVPITANGIGIRQSMGVYLFSKIDVTPTIALNMYIISLSITYLLAFFLYSYFSYFDGNGVRV